MLHYVQHDKMIGDQKFSDSLPPKNRFNKSGVLMQFER